MPAACPEIPQVCPNAREFIPPALEITEAQTQAGTVVRRIWASQSGGGSLRLSFANIPDADAEGLARIWDCTKGRRLALALPTWFFEGEDPALVEHLELKGRPLPWGLRGEPTIRSVIPGISSIDLEFKGRGYGGGAISVVTPNNYPAVCPTGRELILPDYPLSEGIWRNGAALFPRPWSDVPVGAILKLQYRNIAGQLAAQFLDCWYRSGLGIQALTLPAEVVDGIQDSDLAARILNPLGLSWRFGKPVAVSSVMPGVNTVVIELKATAEQPYVDPADPPDD